MEIFFINLLTENMIKKVGKLRTLVSFVNNLLINVATVETNNDSIFLNH